VKLGGRGRRTFTLCANACEMASLVM
jgi:hypothetical protein